MTNHRSVSQDYVYIYPLYNPMKDFSTHDLFSQIEAGDDAIIIFDAATLLIKFANNLSTIILKKPTVDLVAKDCREVLGDFWALNNELINEIMVHHSIIKRMIDDPSNRHNVSDKKIHVQYERIPSEVEGSKWIKISLLPLQSGDRESRQSLFNPTYDPIIELAKSNELLSNLNTQLLESQDNLQSAFEAGNMGHCGINFVSGEVTLSNKSRFFFGIPEDIEVTWETLLEAVNPEYHQMVNKAFSDAIDKGDSVDSTYSITHLISGELRWIRVRAKVHHDSTGKPLKLFGLVMDITEEKNDEQRKNDFITMVSHELKTPLTVIQAYIQIIQRKLDNNLETLIQELLGKTNIQMNRMSKLINGFLNVSRLESGKLDIQSEKFDFKKLIEDVAHESHSTVSTHYVHIGNVPEIVVYADRDKIQQVLNNLVSNAVKYSPVNSDILIKCELTDNVLVVHVIDQGMGLDGEAIPQVFDRFYRVDSKTTENVSGFGIGLYICKEIIQRHGGQIWVKSTLGEGSIFSFTIPINGQEAVLQLDQCL